MNFLMSFATLKNSVIENESNLFNFSQIYKGFIYILFLKKRTIEQIN